MKNAIPHYVNNKLLSRLENGNRKATFLLPVIKFSLLVSICLLVANLSFGQTAGDYRSNAASMNWNAASSWQKYSGSAWAASSDYPGQNACSSCTVTIQNGHTVTLNVSPANSVGNIVIGGGTSGTLTLGTFTLIDAGNLTVNAGASLNLSTGTFSVGGTTATAGTILDNNNTGVNTFTGLVTKTAGTWTSTAVTTASNMIFNGGFTNTAGTFSAGAATVADNQTLTGTVNMSFANGVTVLGNADLNIAGTTTNGVSFGGTSINYSVRNLTLTGLLTVSTTGNLTVTGTTSISGTGAFTDNNNAGITSFAGSVTHNSTGAFTSTTVTTAANMVFSAGFTNTAGSFSAGAATIGDNQTLTGTVNMSFANGLTVLGNADINIAGTASAGVTFGGTSINYSVRNLTLTGLLTVSTTGNLTVTGTTSITGTGAFTDNSNTGITSFAGLVTHNSTGAWTSTTVTTAANMVFTGGFTNTLGTFTAGAATIGDNKTLTGTINMSFANGLTVLGNGDLTIAGTATTGVSFAGTAINYSVRNLTLTGRLAVTTTGNLAVTGTTSITGTGAFIDNNNAGSTIFTGLVTHNSTGSWTTTTITTAANLVFNGGFTNTAGAFSAGAATVANGQTLNGGIIMVFSNGLVVSGGGNITFAGAGGVRLAGTAINYTIPGNLTLTGTLLVSTTGNFTVTGTTSITGAGDFTDNNNTGITTFTGLVTHNSTGRFISTSVTTAANMVFTGGFTNTAGSFSAGAATIGDNQTLTGTVNMSFNRGITVLGNADLTIAGNATNGVSFGGTLINYSVRNLTLTGLLTASTTGNVSITGTTTISGAGAFLDNNGTGITTFTGLVTVGSTSTFTATAVTTIGRLIFAGGITQNNTTALSFNVGTLRTSATQTWTGAGTIKTTGVLDVNVGTLTNNITGTVTVGGTLTGTTLVQGSNAKLILSSTTPLSITTLTSTASGNTVEYAALGNATLRGQTYYHLTISGSGTKTIPTTDITVNGNLTINAGVLSNTTNNRNIVLAGNWVNNVGATAFTAGTGTVTFSGTTAQNINGSGVTTFKNVTINNATGVTQSTNSTITGVLTFTTGIFTTGSSTLIISSTGSVSRTSGHINGNEQMNIATGAGITKTFDIGDATVYSPVSLNFASVSVSGNITAKSTPADHPSIIYSTLNGGVGINRFWTLSNSGTTFTTYSATFTFVAGDKDVTANTSNLLVGNYNGTTWSYPTVGTKTSTSTQANSVTGFGDFALAEFATCSTPNLVIHDPAAVCKPSTVNITTVPVTAGSTSGLTLVYYNDSLATSVLSSPSAIAVAGTYYIKGVITGGCYNIKPVVVSINSPTGVISGSTTICTGQTATLSIAVTGTGPWSGTLSNGTAFSGSTSPISVNVNPTTNTTYTISTLIDANCTAQTADKTGSATVTVLALPTTANAGTDQNYCGTNFTLAANTPTVGTGSWSIISGSGGTISNPTSPTSTFTATAGVTYVLRWSITNSPCTISYDDVTIASTGGLWIGSVDADWNNPANWCGGILPTGTNDLILPAGLANYPEITSNIIVSDVTIATGASLTITADGILNITGVYNNSGTLTNDGSIVLNGNVVQNFPGSTATINSMNNLEVDNAAGVSIDKSFTLTGTLTSTNGTIDLNDKNITLYSDSANTAAVAPVSGNFAYTGGGKFIVQRFVPSRRAWRLLTSPLTNTNSIYNSWQNGGVYAPGVGTMITTPGGGNGTDAGSAVSMKTFNYNTQALINVTNTNVPISGNTGSADNITYFTFVRGDRSPLNIYVPNSNNTTLSSAGELQTGDQTFNAASLNGKYTMVGNPYAAPVDFDKTTLNNLMKRFYVWDPTLNAVGGYVMLDDLDGDGNYSKSVAGSDQTKIIESGQAILVQTSSDGPASITFTEDCKATASLSGRPAGTGNSATLVTNLFLLNGTTTTLADGTLAEFNDIYNRDYSLEDATKVTNTNENIGFFRGNKTLAAERMPIPMEGDTLFYRLTKTTARAYRMQIKATNANQKSANAMLQDSYLNTNTLVNLNGITIIDFVVNADPASAAADRFKLVFRQQAVLPVKFANIVAVKKPNANLVQWSIENEMNVKQYEVEKSTDGKNYNIVNTTTATNNNNSSVSYNWTDNNVTTENSFYRIKCIENNGNSYYSEITMVSTATRTGSIKAILSPNASSITMQFAGQKNGIYKIHLLKDNGQLVYTDQLNIADVFVSQNLDIKKTISKGIYILEIVKPDNSKETIKLIK